MEEKSQNTYYSNLPNNLFDEGFGDFLNQSVFSDLKLISTNDKEFKVHKIILSFASEYFAKKLNEQDTHVMVKFHYENILIECLKILEGPFFTNESGNSDFELFLKYIYEGRIQFTAQNAVPLLAMAGIQFRLCN